LAQVAVDAEHGDLVPALFQGVGDLIDDHVVGLGFFLFEVTEDGDAHRQSRGEPGEGERRTGCREGKQTRCRIDRLGSAPPLRADTMQPVALPATRVARHPLRGSHLSMNSQTISVPSAPPAPPAAPDSGGVCTIVLPHGNLRLPASAFTLKGFRAWAKPEAGPQHKKVAVPDLDDYLDMGGQERTA